MQKYSIKKKKCFNVHQKPTTMHEVFDAVFLAIIVCYTYILLKII